MSLKTIIFIGAITFLTLTIRNDQIFPQKTIDAPANFTKIVESKLKNAYGVGLDKICPVETDPVADRVFREYGAIFVSNNGGNPPPKCIFNDEAQVRDFQAKTNPKTMIVGGKSITLQESAMNALVEAVEEGAQKNLAITPRGSSFAATRSYRDSVRLWDSRFIPALNYWVVKGKISRQEAEDIKTKPTGQQVAKVLDWESKGIFFSKDFSKSIIFSVAAPGASQHLFMLALDVEQFSNLKVRNLLAKHGWFQTVKSDLPHFTYLGVDEKDLPQLGLQPFLSDGHKFWLTNY